MIYTQENHTVFAKYKLTHGSKDWAHAPRYIKITEPTQLPQKRAYASYKFTRLDGSFQVVQLRKRQRQILDLLRKGPVLCGSNVRIGMFVKNIKDKVGDDFCHTQRYAKPNDPDATWSGLYFLCDTVEYLGEIPKNGEVA